MIPDNTDTIGTPQTADVKSSNKIFGKLGLKLEQFPARLLSPRKDATQ